MTTKTMTAQIAGTATSGPLALVRRAFHGVVQLFASTSAAMAAAREVERLMALSDAELARRGLTRDEIVRHAFRRYLAL